MKTTSIKKDAGFLALALRLVVGWTYFSAFWRRLFLADKLDSDTAGYIGEKFNHFLPHALGIKPMIEYLVTHPEALWWHMVIFTIIEGIVGFLIMFGFFTRLMSIGVFMLALGILLGSGWIGTTCLDEWQIGILGIATGFLLFLTGSGKFSIDNYLIKRNFKITQKKSFQWLASGILPIKDQLFSKIVIIGSFIILGISLYTNQVFHGGLWGTLHNKSVKPYVEISNGKIENNHLSFEVYRTEGVDVYGAWIIGIELKNSNNETVLELSHNDFATSNTLTIDNYYVTKVKPGKHSLIIPLGAKAKLSIKDSKIENLDNNIHTLKITDISGASWEHHVNN